MTELPTVIKRSALALLAVAALAGCSLRSMAVNAVVPTLANPAVYLSEEDPEVARDALPFLLKTIESILDAEPDRQDALLFANTGFLLYASAFLQADAELAEWDDYERAAELNARAHRMYLRARDYGLRNVELDHPGIAARLRDDPPAATAVFDGEDVESLYYLGGAWMLDALLGMAEMTPDDPWVTQRLAGAETAEAKRSEERKRFAVGAGIRDFVAQRLDGEAVRLADVRTDSEVVLVEFWASWCGPCRVEIPHMKQAYSRYRDRGFEIVSFTIDNLREDWEVASEEEQLPWPNLGMGEDADAPRAYNVTGVPKNYLVDSATGKILAKDLRGHHLDEKLAELLGRPGTAAPDAASHSGMIKP